MSEYGTGLSITERRAAQDGWSTSPGKSTTYEGPYTSGVSNGLAMRGQAYQPTQYVSPNNSSAYSDLVSTNGFELSNPSTIPTPKPVVGAYTSGNKTDNIWDVNGAVATNADFGGKTQDGGFFSGINDWTKSNKDIINLGMDGAQLGLAIAGFAPQMDRYNTQTKLLKQQLASNKESLANKRQFISGLQSV